MKKPPKRVYVVYDSGGESWDTPLTSRQAAIAESAWKAMEWPDNGPFFVVRYDRVDAPPKAKP